MQFALSNIKNNIKFRIISVTLILFFFFKLFFTSQGSAPYMILNELLMVIVAGAFILYLSDFIRPRKINPFSLVMNVGILNAIIGSLYLSSGSTFLSLIIGLPVALYINIYLVKNISGFEIGKQQTVSISRDRRL